MLDRDELQRLAQQLSLQVDYNNTLLSQLHLLETQHMGLSTELKDKQLALKQAMSVGDAARMEANDLRRKVSQKLRPLVLYKRLNVING